MVLQEGHEQPEPHLHKAPQQFPDFLDEDAVDWVVVLFGPHIILKLIVIIEYIKN